MTADFEDRLQSKLEALERLSLRRRLPDLEQGNARRLRRDGEQFVNFSSNDYLGMSTSQEVIQTAQAVLERHGLGSGGSRLISGNHPLYERLETQLADWKQTEAALVFGSGYLTSLGVLRALMNSRDAVFYDELSHRCLLEGIQLSGAHAESFPHNDTQRLRAALDRSRDEYDAVLIVTEGVFSMDGDRCDLESLRAIKRDYDAWLMVDEAHSAGVLGPEGAGLTVTEGDVELAMGTLSKALGGYGGYVAGSSTLVEFLVNRAMTLIYSTGLPAGVVAGALTSLKILRGRAQGRERLLERVDELSNALEDRGIPHPDPPSQIVPLVTGDPDRTLRAARVLRDHGVYGVPIRHPTVPRNRGRVRISLRADHTSDDLGLLLRGVDQLDEEDCLTRDKIWSS